MNNALFIETEGACRVWPADGALSFKYIGIYIYFKMHSSNIFHTFQLIEKDFKTFFLEPELHRDEILADLSSVVELYYAPWIMFTTNPLQVYISHENIWTLKENI